MSELLSVVVGVSVCVIGLLGWLVTHLVFIRVTCVVWGIRWGVSVFVVYTVRINKEDEQREDTLSATITPQSEMTETTTGTPSPSPSHTTSLSHTVSISLTQTTQPHTLLSHLITNQPPEVCDVYNTGHFPKSLFTLHILSLIFFPLSLAFCLSLSSPSSLQAGPVFRGQLGLTHLLINPSMFP